MNMQCKEGHIMKTAICFYSKHHGNTKKLLDAIQAADPEAELIDVTKRETVDLSDFERIGFASGIYYSSFAKPLIRFLRENLPEGKPVFFLYSSGMGSGKKFTSAITEAAREKNAQLLGSYGCFGFDTFGPFKLLGGIRKGHPNTEELQAAVTFYKGLQ